MIKVKKHKCKLCVDGQEVIVDGLLSDYAVGDTIKDEYGNELVITRNWIRGAVSVVLPKWEWANKKSVKFKDEN